MSGRGLSLQVTQVAEELRCPCLTVSGLLVYRDLSLILS